MALMQNTTRIAVQIAIQDNTGHLVTLAIALTHLVSLLVKLSGLITKAAQWLTDFSQATQFTLAVLTIGFKSLTFGFLGVKL